MSKNLKLNGETNKKPSNRKRSTKKKLTQEDIFKMKCIPLDLKSFQRTARSYYKTLQFGSSLSLFSPNGNSVSIRFEHDRKHGYIILRFSIKRGAAYDVVAVEMKKPRYNRDLFIKLLKYDLL